MTAELRDPLGLPLRLQRADSLPAVHGFVEGLLGHEPRILDVLAAAQSDDAPTVQACAACLHLFSESAAGPAAAQRHLARAQASEVAATARERAFMAAVAHWAANEPRRAIATLDALLQSHPRDLTALKLAQYLAFNLGDAPTMLRLALRSREAAEDLAAWHGLLAFGLEQCHRLDEAEAAAREALRLQPDEPWAQHAIAHVQLTQGRLREGAAFLQSASGGWSRLTSFMRTHQWWHLALFHIELGEEAEALRLYDDEVWGVDKTCTQDQVGAVSLLARLELAGVDVGPRWQELAGWVVAHAADQVLPFLDLQYLVGLARARHPEAGALLERIERFAPQAPMDVREAWQRVALPVARGLEAHAHRRWREAAQALGPVLPGLVEIGGSHAQRDLFVQIHLDALVNAGEWSDARDRLRLLTQAQPESLRLKRQLAALDRAEDRSGTTSQPDPSSQECP